MPIVWLTPCWRSLLRGRPPKQAFRNGNYVLSYTDTLRMRGEQAGKLEMPRACLWDSSQAGAGSGFQLAQPTRHTPRIDKINVISATDRIAMNLLAAAMAGEWRRIG